MRDRALEYVHRAYLMYDGRSLPFKIFKLIDSSVALENIDYYRAIITGTPPYRGEGGDETLREENEKNYIIEHVTSELAEIEAIDGKIRSGQVEQEQAVMKIRPTYDDQFELNLKDFAEKVVVKAPSGSWVHAIPYNLYEQLTREDDHYYLRSWSSRERYKETGTYTGYAVSNTDEGVVLHRFEFELGALSGGKRELLSVNRQSIETFLVSEDESESGDEQPVEETVDSGEPSEEEPPSSD